MSTELDAACEGMSLKWQPDEDDRTTCELVLAAIDPRIASLPAGTVTACINWAIWAVGDKQLDDAPTFEPDAYRAIESLARGAVTP